MPYFCCGFKIKKMKILIITAVIAILFSVTAFAADGGRKIATGEPTISYTLLNKFAADFKNAKNATWTVTSNCQKVSFTLNGVQLTAFYDLSGEYAGTTQEVDYKTIPFAAQEEIAAAYKGYDVKEVVKFQYDINSTDINAATYFVDLKKAGSEIVVKTATGEKTSLFKTIK